MVGPARTAKAEFSVDGLVPHEAVFPEGLDDIAEILRGNRAVIPWGGGTQIGLGNIPRAADVVVSTTKLNRVLEYEPADLVVTVEAGISLGELQRVLGERGQFLALDPPLPDRATIGGIIAANSSGPLRWRHGTCRDMLIGIKVVNPGGDVTKAGGKVVKNVSGYDMGKLYTGSLGTLGIIVEASFKLTPLPPFESTVLAWFGELGKAFETAWAIYKSALPIRACELLSPAAAEAIGKGGGYLLAVWIGGGQAALERQNREITALCSSADQTQLVEGDDMPPLWRGIEDFGHDGQAKTLAKLSVLPSKTGELLARLPKDAKVLCHVLVGVTYVHDIEPEEAFKLAQDLGGYCVLEVAPLEVKQRLDVWGPPGPDFRLMERIKREFDPNGILNPGRYLGRL